MCGMLLYKLLGREAPEVPQIFRLWLLILVEGKDLLLKITHASVIGHREMKLETIWNLPRYRLVFTLPEGARQLCGGESSTVLPSCEGFSRQVLPSSAVEARPVVGKQTTL